MDQDEAAHRITAFFRSASERKSLARKLCLVKRVRDAAVTVQSFFKMLVVRRTYQFKLRIFRRQRHATSLSRYLTSSAAATLTSFLPQRQKQEEMESLVRRLVLFRGLSHSEALSLTSKCIEDWSSDKARSKSNVHRRTKDVEYGGFCNSRVVAGTEETSDSDDNSIDDELLACRRPGRALSLM